MTSKGLFWIWVPPPWRGWRSCCWSRAVGPMAPSRLRSPRPVPRVGSVWLSTWRASSRSRSRIRVQICSVHLLDGRVAASDTTVSRVSLENSGGGPGLDSSGCSSTCHRPPQTTNRQYAKASVGTSQMTAPSSTPNATPRAGASCSESSCRSSRSWMGLSSFMTKEG